MDMKLLTWFATSKVRVANSEQREYNKSPRGVRVMRRDRQVVWEVVRRDRGVVWEVMRRDRGVVWEVMSRDRHVVWE